MKTRSRVALRRLPPDPLAKILGHLKTRLETMSGQVFDTVVLGGWRNPSMMMVLADAAGQAELGRWRPRLQAHRIPVRADRGSVRLRAEGFPRGNGAIVDVGGGTSDFMAIRASRAGRVRPPEWTTSWPTRHRYRRHRLRFAAQPVVGHAALVIGTSDQVGKRDVPAGYFVDLATWHRINLLIRQAKTDPRHNTTLRLHGLSCSTG